MDQQSKVNLDNFLQKQKHFGQVWNQYQQKIQQQTEMVASFQHEHYQELKRLKLLCQQVEHHLAQKVGLVFLDYLGEPR